MTYQEVWEKARETMAPQCRVCPECNGKACSGEIPGLGGVGSGNSFTIAREYLKKIQVWMDVAYEPAETVDTSVSLFGRTFSIPFFEAPLGGLAINYNGAITDGEFMEMSVNGMIESGGFAFTPDGPNDSIFLSSLAPIQEAGGIAVPTIKPWSSDKIIEKIHMAEEVGAMAIACDIDSSGNPNLKKVGKPVYPMSPKKMQEIAQSTSLPFIPKGIMTPAAALRCADAGCYGIVVSNHGGRVLEDSPAPASVLPAIRDAVGDRLKIFVDGGIRSGSDVFKCLALGADAVLIGRPYGPAAFGGGKEGIRLYNEKIRSELQATMVMTGCNSIADITIEKIANY